MKIALVCFNLSWQAGGVRLLYEEAHALKRLGHTVVLYAPEFDEKVYSHLRLGIDIRVIRPPEAIVWQFKSRNLIARIFEKWERERQLRRAARHIAEAMDTDFDIVNVHDFAYRVARWYRARNPRAKIVWYMADPPYMYLPKANVFYDFASRLFNWYADRVERRYFRYIDVAAVLVRRNKAWLEERVVPAMIVWTGINFDAFFASVRSVFKTKPITLMSVGALNKYRRFEDVIDAVKLLRDEGYNVWLTVVCKNIWRQDDYLQKLRTFVAERKLAAYVELRSDGASEEELKKLYAMSHIFVLPIHLPPPRNGFGWQMVAFEALAAGLPLIVSRKNDVVEVLRDDETALFVDPMRPDQIAAKVKMLIDKPEFYKKIATAGQEFIRTNMSWEKFAQGIIDAAGK